MVGEWGRDCPVPDTRCDLKGRHVTLISRWSPRLHPHALYSFQVASTSYVPI